MKIKSIYFSGVTIFLMGCSGASDDSSSAGGVEGRGVKSPVMQEVQLTERVSEDSFGKVRGGGGFPDLTTSTDLYCAKMVSTFFEVLNSSSSTKFQGDSKKAG